MKKILTRILPLLVGLLTTGLVSASDYCRNEGYVTLNDQSFVKVYVEPKQVNISKDHIHIQLDDMAFDTDSIFSNGAGVFVLIPADNVWECEECSFSPNLDYTRSCHHCGHHRR